MELIDKATVVAEIDKFMYGANLEADIASTGECFNEEVANAKYKLCKQIKDEINTLEVKEVDLKKEYRDYINCDNGHTMFEIAVHFFELGMQQAQKGE